MDLSFLTKLFRSDLVVFPLLFISTVFATYMWSDKVFTKLYEKSTSKKQQVMLYMKLLGMEVNEKNVTRLLLLSSFGIGFLLFMIVWPNMQLGLFLGISFGIAGFQVVPLIYKSLYEKRCDQFVDQMVDALTIMANGIKSGSNAQQSMQRVVEIMANPVRSEFAQVITQTQFGQSFEEALTDLGERIPRPDVQMFVTAINILKETGGNLGETFQTIVSTIRERQKLEKKISAMTAQGIMQGIIVSSIPFILGAVFFAVDPNYIKPMFTTLPGIIGLAIMLVLQLIGGIVIKKIVTIKV